MNPDSARKVLAEGADLLNKLGVDWWLSAGTLLGAYRDGLSDEFLEADTDIDIGVRGDGLYREILTTFALSGYKQFRTYKTDGKWTQLALIKDGVLFDIYFFYPVGDELVNWNEHGVMSKPASLFGSYTVDVSGVQYPCPNPEPYLEVRYGKDWRVPQGKVEWQEQAANLNRS